MFDLHRPMLTCALLCAVTFATATAAAAQTVASTPALPPYPDQAPSVYLASQPGAAKAIVEPTAAVKAAKLEVPVAAPEQGIGQARRLTRKGEPGSSASISDRRPADSPLSFGLPADSIYTMVTSLVVVVGLFLLCAGLVRRGARKSNALLPQDVVRVLGRVPLAARQFAELVHVGNKLVLVSVTATGAETLTEVTDPAEVDRLLGLCQQRSTNSSTAEFDRVFRQLADAAPSNGHLGRDGDMFAGYQGGPRRG